MRPLFNDRQTKCKSLSGTKRLTGSTVWLSLSFGQSPFVEHFSANFTPAFVFFQPEYP